MSRLSSALLVVFFMATTARASVTADFGTALSPSGTGYDTGSNVLDPGDVSFTAEAWINASSTSAGPVLVELGGSSGTTGTWLRLFGSALIADFNGFAVTGDTAVSAGTWHHVAVVHDHVRHVVYLYLDGKVVGTRYGHVPTAAGDLIIGGDGTSTHFSGAIDEVRIWSRARGTLEIQKDMNLALAGTESNLKAYYNFNDGATTGRTTDGKTGFSTIVWNGSVSGVLPASNGGSGTLTYGIVSQGTMGTMSVTSSTGQFTYTVSAASTGYDTVTYCVSNGSTTVNQTLTVGIGTLNRAFTQITGSSSPFYGYTFWSDQNHLRFADLDGDGDVDFYQYDDLGYGSYVENTGTVTSPAFSAPSSNPFPNESWCIGGSTSFHESNAVICMTGDGAVTECSTWSGSVDYTCNGGYQACVTGGQYTCEDTFETVSPYNSVAFVDHMNDGLWDFISFVQDTNTNDQMRLYTNGGSSTTPSFSLSSDSDFNSYPDPSYTSSVTIADVMGNGWSDAVFVDPYKTYPLETYPCFNEFLWAKAPSDPLGTFSMGTSNDLLPSAAAIGDLDGDGAFDIVMGGNSQSGQWSKSMQFFYNSGTSLSPSFPSYTTSVLRTTSTALVADPVLVDLDGDGDLDLVEGGTDEEDIYYYQNDTTFVVKDTPPVASSVSFSGTMAAGATVIGSYKYSSANSFNEWGTTYQWYQASSSSGSGATAISGATSQTLIIPSTAYPLWIAFCVTPNDGIEAGAQACSSYRQVTLACGGLSSGQTMSSGETVWSCGGTYQFSMQTDGNLVLYKSGTALWASNTAGHSGATATMQGDGNLVIYLNGTPLWASNTSGHSGATLAVQSSDGNVVIYLSGKALWATGT